MPCRPCGPNVPFESRGEEAGSTAMTRTSGQTRFRYRAAPVSVPPVPTPATNAPTLSLKSRAISGPVVFSWARAFSGLSNWPGMIAPGSSRASCRAFSIAPAMPFLPSVRTTSAP